jgi:hypothetical protein
MGTGVLSQGLKRGRGVTLTTHPHLIPRSRMSRSYTSSTPSPSVACSGTALAIQKTWLNVGCSAIRKKSRDEWSLHFSLSLFYVLAICHFGVRWQRRERGDSYPQFHLFLTQKPWQQRSARPKQFVLIARRFGSCGEGADSGHLSPRGGSL